MEFEVTRDRDNNVAYIQINKVGDGQVLLGTKKLSATILVDTDNTGKLIGIELLDARKHLGE